jgi:hypothetical protein
MKISNTIDSDSDELEPNKLSLAISVAADFLRKFDFKENPPKKPRILTIIDRLNYVSSITHSEDVQIGAVLFETIVMGEWTEDRRSDAIEVFGEQVATYLGFSAHFLNAIRTPEGINGIVATSCVWPDNVRLLVEAYFRTMFPMGHWTVEISDIDRDRILAAIRPIESISRKKFVGDLI